MVILKIMIRRRKKPVNRYHNCKPQVCDSTIVTIFNITILTYLSYSIFYVLLLVLLFHLEFLVASSGKFGNRVSNPSIASSEARGFVSDTSKGSTSVLISLNIQSQYKK